MDENKQEESLGEWESTFDQVTKPMKEAAPESWKWIKDFICSLLAHQKQEIIAVAEGMMTNSLVTDDPRITEAHNGALSAFIEAIKGK